MFDELKGDYVRHGRSLRSAGFWLVANYRFGRWARGLPGPAAKLAGMAYGCALTACDFLMGSEMHRDTDVGEGVHIIHADCVRIAPNAVLGNRVGIMHGVTIGTSIDRPGAPVIGDDVFIGAGAKILGPVRVGDRARIAPNSLVVNDVPPDTTAIGVPARVLHYTGRAPAPAPVMPAPAPAAVAAAGGQK